MELDKAQETIQAAETLVSKLDGEFKRWSGQVRYDLLAMNFNSSLAAQTFLHRCTVLDVMSQSRLEANSCSLHEAPETADELRLVLVFFLIG